MAALISIGAGARAASPAPATAPGGVIDFNHDIRPILSEKCFLCHGPDEKGRKGGRKGGLRLDTQAGQREDLGGYAAVVPGQPDASALLQRIVTADEDDLMPPRKTGKPLSPAEIDLLRRWIAGGARFSRHWAYEKPVRPPLPHLREASWPRHPVDAFLLARLEREGLAPQPEADRFTLARRAALDLVGLPPAPEEVEALVHDTAPGAFERYVDALLARPAYGEHWARLWLDLARYADSAGYADDPPRTIWPYRDYVIRAFNRNLPFDQFTIEQLAGDLLPDPTEEQLKATAFHRNTMTNSEGGTNDEEFRNVAIVDRVNTTFAVWMGTSMACAQCHSHKYDPISQTEYFQLFAFLNNTADADRPDESPVLEFYPEPLRDRRADLDARIARINAGFEAPAPEWVEAALEWARAFPARVEWQTPRPAAFTATSGAILRRLEDDSLLVVGPGTNRLQDTYTIELPVETPATLTALRLEALPHESLDKNGPGLAGDFRVRTVRARLKPAPGPGPEQDLEFAFAAADHNAGSLDAALVASDRPQRPSWDPHARKPGEKGWGIGDATGRDHTLTLVAAHPVDLPPGATLTVTIAQKSGSEGQALGRFRLRLTGDPRASEHAATPPAVLAALDVPAADRDTTQRRGIIEHYVRHLAPDLAGERERLAVLERERDELKPWTVPICRELEGGERRGTKVQLRGNFLITGDEVTEGVPAAWHPLPDGAPRNRLTLARWLVSEDNPLTARVLANRLWEQIFGHGIVRTTEEFGSQGEPPEHPELLDWLACDLMATGWDMKRFLRGLVTSAAYRQSSRVTPEALEKDPDNRWVSRGPRFRLSAEMIRDQALATGGLLSGTLFGPPVRPVRPNLDLRAAFGGNLDWKPSGGADQHRRGLYTEWRRTSPYPSMATFDAPSREVCTLRRNRSNTPLQALVTLNDPVFIGAAQGLAQRMILAAASPRERVRTGFQIVLARPPSAAEEEELTTLQRDAQAGFARDPEQAASFAGPGAEGTGEDGAARAERAAWTTVANVLLNLDETLMKR